MNRLPEFKTLVLMAAGVVLIGLAATTWTMNVSKDAKERYNALAEVVPEEDSLREMLATSQYSVDQYRIQLEHLEQGVPNLAYMPTLLQELELLGIEHDIEVTGVRPIIDARARRKDKKGSKGKLGEDRKSYQEIMIDMTGRGSYTNVKSLVEALKAFPKIVAVQTVGLTPKRNKRAGEATEGQAPILEATVRIKAFVFTEEKAKDTDTKPEAGS